MKGVVFTEFLEMVEAGFGLEMVDDVIDASGSDSGGAYTSVGTYDHLELIRMVVKLAELSGETIPNLVGGFGQYLFRRFVVLYPALFDGVHNAFDLLENVETSIHTEVRKLYPDAELPSLDTTRDGDTMRLTYKSPRCMSDFAEGLILGCAQHFGEELAIQKQDKSDGDGSLVEFAIQRVTV